MGFIERQQKPVLLLDENRCKRNIQRIFNRVKKAGTIFRPHVKTHQSIVVGRWFRDAGVTGITVSSIEMAKYFIKDGWDDITIAFPFFYKQLDGLKEIERKSKLRLFVHSIEDLQLLNNELSNPFRFYIEIDPGSRRSGISSRNVEVISDLISRSHKLNKSTFHGFYIHDGRTYTARSEQEIKQQINPTIDILKDLKSKFPEASISLGDTPSASVSDRLNELDETTPGNFVFYDYMQVQIGSCTLDDVALFIILPIAQKIPTENRTIVHGGAVHLSKEFLEFNQQKNFGQVIQYSEDQKITQTNLFINAISQEHGSLNGVPQHSDSVWVCPIHSCLTANLHSVYYRMDGHAIEKRILS